MGGDVRGDVGAHPEAVGDVRPGVPPPYVPDGLGRHAVLPRHLPPPPQQQQQPPGGGGEGGGGGGEG